MRARWLDGLASALALGPVAFLLARLAARRFTPEGDPTVMLSVERSVVAGCYLAALFATALLATGTVALVSRRGVDGGRVVSWCFALGALATVAGAAVLR